MVSRNPRSVLVLRHAERPAAPGDRKLSSAGRARAKALARFLPERFGAIDFIFAAAVSRHSARPYETMKPLSKRIGVAVDATIADPHYEILAGELLSHARYAGRLIVICWHHGNIPSLMHALGAAVGSFPDPWDPAVFNLVLQVDYGRAVPNVRQIAQPF